jgi:hypothetical protein
MPIPAPSAYERDRQQRQDARRQRQQRDRLSHSNRADIEEALDLDKQASRLERNVQAYDDDVNGFRQRAIDERRQWWNWIFFCAAVAIGAIGDFFVSADVTEWLAHSIVPLFYTDTVDVTPVWLRIGTGIGFVILMLGVTLLLKYVTFWFLANLRERRNHVVVGDDATYRALTWQIWVCQGAKIGYMLLLGIFYFWLYGFALERAALMASIDAASQIMSLDTGYSIALDGELELATPSAVAQENTTATSQLASSYAVLYGCIWLLHGLILVLPTDGFGRELALSGFRREAAEQQVNTMQEQRDRLLRTIVERIRDTPADTPERDILVRQIFPIRELLNQAAGIEVFPAPEQPATTYDAPTRDDDDLFADDTEATANVAEDPQDVYGVVFGDPQPNPQDR